MLAIFCEMNESTNAEHEMLSINCPLAYTTSREAKGDPSPTLRAKAAHVRDLFRNESTKAEREILKVYTETSCFLHRISDDMCETAHH